MCFNNETVNIIKDRQLKAYMYNKQDNSQKNLKLGFRFQKEGKIAEMRLSDTTT